MVYDINNNKIPRHKKLIRSKTTLKQPPTNKALK